jgi:hypothetical protein
MRQGCLVINLELGAYLLAWLVIVARQASNGM